MHAPAARDGGGSTDAGAGCGRCVEEWARELASGRDLFLPSDWSEIENRIASGAKYRVCWIRFLVRFLFF